MTAESDITKLLKDITGVHLGANESSVLLMQMPIEFSDGGIYMRFNDFDKAGKAKPDVRVDNDPQWRSLITNTALQIHGIKDSINVLFKSSKQRKKFVVWLYNHMMAWDNTTVKARLQGSADRTAVIRLYKDYGYENSPEPSFDDLADEIRIIQLTALFEEFRNDTKKQYVKGNTDYSFVPDAIASPSKNLKYALTTHAEGGAYLQLTSKSIPKELDVDNGKLFILDYKGNRCFEAELEDVATKQGIQEFDEEPLKVFYSIILKIFENTGCKDLPVEFSLPIRGLAKAFGYKQNISTERLQEIRSITDSYHNVVGIIKERQGNREFNKYFKVLVFHSYDESTGIIKFAAPYLDYVIRKSYKLAIRWKGKKGRKVPDKTKSGKYKLTSRNVFFDTSLIKEKNKLAVENVIIIYTTICEANGENAHIAVKTIIERNEKLKDRLEHTKNKTVVLDRAFKKTWELLRTRTDVLTRFEGLKLPDPEDVPTGDNFLTKVYTFSNTNKTRNKDTTTK